MWGLLSAIEAPPDTIATPHAPLPMFYEINSVSIDPNEFLEPMRLWTLDQNDRMRIPHSIR